MADSNAALQRLDSGSIHDMFADAPNRIQNPIVQCAQVRPMQSKDGQTDRYRVVFNDGRNYIQSMLATTCNEEVTSERLRRGVLVKLLGYQANTVKGGKKVLIVTALQTLPEYGEHETLGNPSAIPQANQEDAQPSTITSTGFYGNQQNQQAQQQSRAMPSHTKPAAGSANHNIYPIEALSIYSHKWTIRARCTNKSDIKTWHNRNGEGKLFSVNLLDDSGEIRATGFNDQCSQLYDVFQEGSVYYISAPCRVQMANKKFSNLNNDYELTFERETVVEKAEDQTSVPQVRYNFTTISDLQSVDKDTTVDVVGVLKDVQEVSQITSKTTSKPYDKRELTLCDDTGYEVRLTVWGKTATSFEVSPGSVVAFKGVKVSDFGGRSLSLLSSGSMSVNPDMPDSHRLKGWYDQGGQATTFNTHQNVQGTTLPGERRSDQTKTIAAVKDEQLGMSETPDYFNLRGSIQWIKQDPFCYPACQVENCNKKVNFMETTGVWRCERHEQEFEKPKYRYIMSVNVGDHTGQMYLSCFDDVGQKIMGMTADDLMTIKDEGDEKKFTDFFAEANFRVWNWRCRAKMENFQEKQEPRYQVLSAAPVDFSADGQKLAALIKQYDNMNL